MLLVKIIAIYIAIINLVTFVTYGIDKMKAKKSKSMRKNAYKHRIPEATLLTLAAIGGSAGAYMGMKVWHHKTLHKKFKYGVPALLLMHFAIIAYYAYHSIL